MNKEDFEMCVTDVSERVKSVLTRKNDEYSDGHDVFHAFIESAKLRQCTIKQALAGMMVKHTTSIYDMIESGLYYDYEVWDEKIMDHINYLYLLSAMTVQQENENEIIRVREEFKQATSMYYEPTKKLMDPSYSKGYHKLVHTIYHRLGLGYGANQKDERTLAGWIINNAINKFCTDYNVKMDDLAVTISDRVIVEVIGKEPGTHEVLYFNKRILRNMVEEHMNEHKVKGGE